MVQIIEYEHNRGHLHNLIDEARMLNLGGFRLEYSESKGTLDNLIKKIGCPATKEKLEKTMGEIIVSRSYDEDWRAYGSIKNSNFFRFNGKIIQEWELQMLLKENGKEKSGEYWRSENMPLIHSLLKTLEHFEPKGINQATIWIECNEKINGWGAYLIESEKNQVIIDYFVGREKFFQNHLNDPNIAFIYTPSYSSLKGSSSLDQFEKFNPESTYKEREKVYRAICYISQFASPKYWDSEVEKFSEAKTKLEKIQKQYNEIIENQKKIVNRNVNRNIIEKPKKYS